MSLVEPTLHAYDMGYYVITSGVEVGITTVKYVHFTLLLVFFFIFSPEELPKCASPAKTHRPKSSQPGDRRRHTTTYASMMARSLFAPRCRITPPCKARFKRSESLSDFQSADPPPSRPSRPPSTLRRPRVLLPTQSAYHPPIALQPLALRANTHRYFSLNHLQSFPKLPLAKSVHTPGFRLFPIVPIMLLGNTLSRLFPELVLLRNTLNRNLSPFRHQIPRVLSATLIPATFMLNPHQTKMPWPIRTPTVLVLAISIPAMFLLIPHQTKMPRPIRTSIAPPLAPAHLALPQSTATSS